MKTALTQKDIRAIIGAAACLRDRVLLSVLWATGMRVSELVTFQADWFDYPARTLTIRHLKSKSGRFRQIPLRRDVADLLAKYILEADVQTGRRVFPVARQHVNVILRQACERAGLKGKLLVHPTSMRPHYISAHKFRDALAVHWLKQRSDMEAQKALQTFLGHQNFDTTARYFKLSGEEVKGVYEDIWTDKPKRKDGR